MQNALDAVHGVDLNPFAVAIARFRLTVEALRVCGLTSLDQAPAFRYHLATGDSLLFGRAQESLPFSGADQDEAMSRIAYSTEDLDQLKTILQPGQYDMVVGNPPYITVKDKKLSQLYRNRHETCKGTYALTVPFMERFFELAKPAKGDQPAGWVGQITSNSFMKREFGSKLIEQFLVNQDLRLVADTSGAYIPGHGTPTVIITGRHQRPLGSTVRAVLGIRGEPGRPENAADGLVWRSIVEHVSKPSYHDQWISVADLDRGLLQNHPWSLTGGAAPALASKLGSHPIVLGRSTLRIGFMAMSHADDAFEVPLAVWGRNRLCPTELYPLIAGEDIRDYVATPTTGAYFPYTNGKLTGISAGTERWLWRLRAELAGRATFGGTYRTDGRAWWSWHQVPKDTGSHSWAIGFAEVATHNHFVLARGGKVFKQTAPVIKLPSGATEDDHLGLLGLLNSSTACFWLKQNCFNKGNGGIGGGIGDEAWEPRYQFAGSVVWNYPLPAEMPLDRARHLDRLAIELAAASPQRVAARGVPTDQALSESHCRSIALRGQMIAAQEELDWAVYGLYGLPGGDLVYAGDDLPRLELGERAFEIALARKVKEGDEETAWFDRHGSTPITEIPDHWPEAYRQLVQRRLDLIATDPGVALLESPEHKRRWASEPWEKQQEKALRGWLLDRLEDRRFWFSGPTPTPRSVAQLADEVSRDADLTSVLALWEGRPDVPVVQSLTKLLTDEAVPFLAAYRLKESGLRKREAWEETWTLQRREDAGQRVGPIPVPPKYTNTDFRKTAWWQARGKLDVPKERFILYPDAGRATDPTLLLGWAGWDHAEQALALASIIAAREAEGRPDEDLVPLVAGLAELQPWVEQWHTDIHPVYGQSLGIFCREQLADRSRQVGKSAEELAAWRPPAPRRGRKATR